jgi:hypothetical protein
MILAKINCMQMKFSKIWHDPVGSKVIAGIILAILGLVTYIKWEWVKGILGQSLQVWFVCLLLAIILLIYFAIKQYRKAPPYVTEYKTDVFKEWRWTWDYEIDKKTKQYIPTNLQSFCPVDNYKLTKQKDGSFAKCPGCGVIYPKERFEKVVDITSLINKRLGEKEFISKQLKK